MLPKLQAFLAERGLQLSETKTRVVHGDEGFNFLGFEVRRWGRPLRTRPQKAKVLAHRADIKAYLQAHKQSPAAVVIKELSPVIRGWANYYRHCAAKKRFQYASHRVGGMLWAWAKRRHPHKSSKWVKARYFRPDGYWTFHDGRAQLYRHAASPITRYVKVRGRATPMDPTQRTYWAERRERQLARVTHQKERLAMLQAQANACALCGIAFGPGDPIDAHHLRPPQAGGGNERINRVLVHRWCHHAYPQRHGYKVAEARAV